MTYKESIDIALLKTDSEESDYERELFTVLANEAQLYIAKYGTHIVRKIDIKVEKAPYKIALPNDFYREAPMGLVNIDDELAGSDHYIVEDNYLVIKQTGNFVFYYWGLPKDLTKLTDEELEAYEYEVADHTQVAIPSYIGYQLIKTDDVQLAQILMNEWNKYLSLFDDVQKPKAVQRRIENTVRWW